MSETGQTSPVSMHLQVIDSLYGEALALMDDARAYFDTLGGDAAQRLDPAGRIGLSSEALKTTTRLMTVVAWLMALRSRNDAEPMEPAANRLGPATASAADVARQLPDTARLLIASSEELYRRAERLQAMMLSAAIPQNSPVHSMVARLENAISVQDNVKKRVASRRPRGKG